LTQNGYQIIEHPADFEYLKGNHQTRLWNEQKVPNTKIILDTVLYFCNLPALVRVKAEKQHKSNNQSYQKKLKHNNFFHFCGTF